MAEKSRERWGQRLQEKGFSPRAVEGEAGKGKKGVKSGIGVEMGNWARELCGSKPHRADRPVFGREQILCTGRGAHTCVDSVVRLQLMLE